MSGAVDRVISALDARGLRPKRSGKGWSARCPAHEDRAPSLSVTEGGDGRAVLHCHARCSFDAVVRALGLEQTDLFADEPAGRRDRPKRTRSSASTLTRTAVAKPRKAAPPKGASTWQAALPRSLGKPAAHWPYLDANGTTVGYAVRWNKPDGTKETIRPVSAAPGGGWIAEAMPEPRPIFNLPNVIAADLVLVVEGEKAAASINALGLVATTSSMGAQAAGKADWGPLAGKRVVILPDHDEAGEDYVVDVTRLATDAGAKSVSVVRLADHWPACPEGGDVADWIEDRGDAAEPADIRAALEAIIGKAEPAEAIEEQADEEDDLAWMPFPTSELPEPISSFVREAAAAIGSDESMVALPMLAMLAGAIGNSRRLRIKPQWSVPPVLWTAVVAESGSGKSPSLRIASRFADDAQTRAFARHEVELAEYEQAMANYELALKDRAKRGGVAPEKPEKPTARRFVASDTTVEALVPILQENPRGVVVAVDELAGWFGSHDCYRPGGRGGVDRPKWLSMFDAGPVTVDRKTSGTAHVPSAAVSITGGVQPSILRSLLTPDAVTSGLVSRFIFAMPPRRRMRWTDESVSFAVMNEVADLCSLLLDGLQDAIIAESGPADLDLDLEAKDEFSRFAEDVYARQAEASGAAAAMLSKLTATAGRLALVIHVVRQAGREPTLANRVDVESVRRGIALARWAGREQQRIYSLLLPDRGVDETADDAARLGRWLADREGGFASDRDIRRGLARFRDEARADAAAARLVAEGRAVRATMPTAGRPAKGLRLVGVASGTFGSGTSVTT